MATPKHAGGRPLLFQSVEELKEKIDDYFENIKDKEEIPTMSGLAYALGCDRTTLVNYHNRAGFFDTVNRARQKIEIFWEQNLLTPKVTAGVSFNLKNNFMGWKDKQEVETSRKVTLVIDDDDAEL